MHAASAWHTDRAGWAMLSFADQETLARLRVVVAAGKPAPLDLARKALLALEQLEDREERLFARDEHIRRAAVLIDGTRWARAGKLKKELKAMERIWSRLCTTQPELMTVRGELHAAALRYKMPGSTRSFFDIISF